MFLRVLPITVLLAFAGNSHAQAMVSDQSPEASSLSVASFSTNPNDPWWGWRTRISSNSDSASVQHSGCDFVRVSDPPFDVPHQDMALVFRGLAAPALLTAVPLVVLLVSRRRRL